MLTMRVLFIEGDQPPIASQYVMQGVPDFILKDKVHIEVGGPDASGSVTVPFAILTRLMAAVTEGANERRDKGLVVPKAPGLIGFND